MEYRTYDASVCVMTRIFAMIGGKWKPIILHLIKNDINRFGVMKRSMPKISKKIRLIRVHKGSQRLEIFEICTRIIVWSFEDKGSVFEFWMTSDAAQCIGADVTFADVPVPVDARVVHGA